MNICISSLTGLLMCLGSSNEITCTNNESLSQLLGVQQCPDAAFLSTWSCSVVRPSDGAWVNKNAVCRRPTP